jgi:hypothetical protein
VPFSGPGRTSDGTCPVRRGLGHIGGESGSAGEELGLEKRSGPGPEDKAATPAEVRGAIEDLAHAQLVRLDSYARWRIRGLGRKAAGRTEADLFRQAVMVTLSGSRKWNKERVDFVQHLRGAMRSISSHWRRDTDPQDEPVLESDLMKTTDEGDVLSPFDLLPAPDPGADRVIEAKQRVEDIEKAFADDTVVSLILAGMRQGMSPPEVRIELELSQTEYETAMKRLRRKVPAIAASGGSDG